LPQIASWEIGNDQAAISPKGITHVVLDTPAGLQGQQLDEVVRHASGARHLALALRRRLRGGEHVHQAALARRDYPAAEAAAREALATRGGTQQANAQLLLGDALSGKRDWGNAAIAYNEAYTRARTSPRAPEALLGLAGAFQGLGSRREACDTLNDLRSNHPNLSAALQERATAARARAQCR
jgi:tetratricopeptide (TPR) repeat protein